MTYFCKGAVKCAFASYTASLFMRISILGSGSEGNSTFVDAGDVAFLVDAGFSAKTLLGRLSSIGVHPSAIKAILITHEHSDHIKGAGVLSRKLGVPIYITPESFHAAKDAIGNVCSDNVRFIEDEFMLDNVLIRPFDVSHDAVRTVGFRIEAANDKKVVISTDIGCYPDANRTFFEGANLLVLEANYDLEMLKSCSYPYHLKKRIHSPSGHLSNNDSAALIGDVFHPMLKKVYLAHISKNSNTYKLALDSVSDFLSAQNISVDLEVAYQHTPTELFQL